jgi:hypothetical protein
MAVERRHPLSAVPHLLRKRKLMRKPPGYRKIYNAAVNADIPAERGDNGRWTIRDSHLELIAERLSEAVPA